MKIEAIQEKADVGSLLEGYRRGQGLPNYLRLLARVIEGAGVVNHKVGGFDFFCFRKLRGHAAGYFFSRRLKCQILAGGEAGDALLVSAGDNDEAVEAFGGAGFENKRGFYDGYGVWVLTAHLIHPFFLGADYRGMNDAVQFLDAGRSWRLRFGARSECRFSQLGTIYRAIGIEHAFPEVANYFVINSVAGAHQIVRDLIRLDEFRAEGSEHLADRRLARGDAAGETDLQQWASGKSESTTETRRHRENKKQ